MSIIKVISKPFTNSDSLENIVAYTLNIPVTRLNENISDIKYICYGVNDLTPLHMIASMRKTKDLFNKTEGKQIHHFILSIYKKNYLGMSNKKMWCDLLCNDVAYYLRTLGYQNIAFIHVKNYECNVHIHFIVNSVNGLTGTKLKNERTFYRNLLHYLRSNYSILNWEFVTYD